MDKFQEYFFTQGILGVVTIGLIIVVVYQQRKIDRMIDKLAISSEARRNDFATTLNEVTKVVSENSQNSRILSEKIETGKRNG